MLFGGCGRRCGWGIWPVYTLARGGCVGGLRWGIRRWNVNIYFFLPDGPLRIVTVSLSGRFRVSRRSQGQISIALGVRVDGLETWRWHIVDAMSWLSMVKEGWCRDQDGSRQAAQELSLEINVPKGQSE